MAVIVVSADDRSQAQRGYTEKLSSVVTVPLLRAMSAKYHWANVQRGSWESVSVAGIPARNASELKARELPSRRRGALVVVALAGLSFVSGCFHEQIYRVSDQRWKALRRLEADNGKMPKHLAVPVTREESPSRTVYVDARTFDMKSRVVRNGEVFHSSKARNARAITALIAGIGSTLFAGGALVALPFIIEGQKGNRSDGVGYAFLIDLGVPMLTAGIGLNVVTILASSLWSEHPQEIRERYINRDSKNCYFRPYRILPLVPMPAVNQLPVIPPLAKVAPAPPEHNQSKAIPVAAPAHDQPSTIPIAPNPSFFAWPEFTSPR